MKVFLCTLCTTLSIVLISINCYAQAGVTKYGSGALSSNNSNGIYNTAFGYYSLNSNIDGVKNTATGANALRYNVGSSYNTANGYAALYNNISGTHNVAIGVYAMFSNLSGYYNTAVGNYALQSGVYIYSGYNTAIGYGSLSAEIDGSSNTAVGYNSQITNKDNYDNTTLGAQSDVLNNVISNSVAIGNSAVVDASNKVRIGNSSITSIGGAVGWSSFSDGRYKNNIKKNVAGLAFINSLTPVTYTVNVKGLVDYYKKGRNDSLNQIHAAQINASEEAAGKIVYSGFIAQDVEQAAKKLNFDFSGVDKPATQDGLYGLRYSDFVVPLVKAVQELSVAKDSLQEKYNAIITENTKLKTDNQVSNERITRLEEAVNQLKAAITNQVITKQPYSISASQIVTTIPGAQPRLDQNEPNPFSRATSIGYYVPESASRASLVLQSVNQQSLATFVLHKGEGIAQIKTTDLSASIYTYVMIVDGRVVASRKLMIGQ